MKKDSVIIVLVLTIAVVSAFAFYFTFKPHTCERYSCFQKYMASCSRASYLNEETEASWKYDIIQQVKGACEIRVTLLQAKEGDLQLGNFKGHTMMCTYPTGVVAYPDKDMSKCHGLLKEDIQGLIIEKLHAYLVENLLSIQEALDEGTNATIEGIV